MEVAQVENKLLEGWMTELRGQQTAYKVSSARTYPYLCTIVQLQLQFGFIVYEQRQHPKMLVEFNLLKLLKERARHQFFNFEYRRIIISILAVYTSVLHTTIIVWLHSLQHKYCVFVSKIEVYIEEFFLTSWFVQFVSLCSLVRYYNIY